MISFRVSPSTCVFSALLLPVSVFSPFISKSSTCVSLRILPLFAYTCVLLLYCINSPGLPLSMFDRVPRGITCRVLWVVLSVYALRMGV